MTGVSAAVAIQQAMVVGEAVRVRTIGRGRDGEGDLGQYARLKNTLSADQRNTFLLPCESLGKYVAGEHVAVTRLLGSEPIEGRLAYQGILLRRVH